MCYPGARKGEPQYGAAMRVRDMPDEDEFPPRRPFGEPPNGGAPEPAEDDELALEAAALCGAGGGQAPIVRS